MHPTVVAAFAGPSVLTPPQLSSHQDHFHWLPLTAHHLK
jgi:hypothetical protein